MVEPLRPTSRAHSRWPGVRPIESLRVLSIRHLADAASAALPAWPEPGRFRADDSARWLWCSPTECLWLGSADASAQALLQSLAPGRDPLACALDQTAGTLAFELDGPTLQRLLPQAMDASAIPALPGQGRRARFGDIAVTVLRIAPGCAWLLADRAYEHYLAHWLDHALAAP